MNTNYSTSQLNIFKWCTSDKINQRTEQPTTSNKQDHHFSNILKFMNRNKKRTISIEGNISSGKSTVIEILKQFGNPDISTLREPIEKWKIFYGVNLLSKMYQDQKNFTNYSD